MQLQVAGSKRYRGFLYPVAHAHVVVDKHFVSLLGAAAVATVTAQLLLQLPLLLLPLRSQFRPSLASWKGLCALLRLAKAQR